MPSQPSDVCHPRLHISQYTVWLSLPFSISSLPGLSGKFLVCRQIHFKLVCLPNFVFQYDFLLCKCLHNVKYVVVLYGLQCSGLGASFCYMLSYLVGRPMVYKYLTERAQKWSQQVTFSYKQQSFLCKLTGHNVELMLFNVIAGGQAQRAPH